MQGGATWGESFALCIVLSADAAHELSHAVAMVVSRLEGMLSNQPTRREDDEIQSGSAELGGVLPFHGGFDCENGENGGIWVIIGNRTNGVEQGQVVLVGRVVAFPSHHVIRTELALALEHLTDILVHDGPFLFLVLIPGSGELEIPWIGEAVGSNRPKFRQGEVMSEDLADPAFDLSLHIDRELDASRDHHDLFGIDNQDSIESPDVEGARVRDNEEIPVRIIKRCLVHGRIG